METKVYNQTGKETGSIALPEGVFNVPWNADLVHQVATSMQANARTPVAHTKNRGEVRGGGKKPWRQKGTGRARHGSIRSPLWRGGGVTFGPRNDKDYSKKINKKMRSGALAAVLSQKIRDNEILFVDRLAFPEPKTKEAKRAILSLSGVNGFARLATKRKNAALIALGEKNSAAEKSFHNFGNIEIKSARSINTLDLLQYKYLILAQPDSTIGILRGRVTREV